jgi:predicted acyltransferase
VQPVQVADHAPDHALAASPRLQSLDVFRGGTIAAMIMVNNNGSSAAYPQLKHAAWHGWTFTDLVFPFFLWIVGVSITLSFAKRVERGDDRGKLLIHVIRRSALIFLIGLLLNGFPYYNLSTIRIPGVLQRIAVCYLIAGTIFLFSGTRARIFWTCWFLASYWVLMVNGGDFSIENNLSRYVDGMMLGNHMYSQTKTWDPEGIVSTLPAVANTLLGILCGELLRSRMSAEQKSSWMFLIGNCLVLAGLLLSTWIPVNKMIWTSSYAVFTSGLAFVVFAGTYWLVDVVRWNRFAKPFAIYGLNALAMYVLSGVFARLLSMIRVGDQSLRSWIWLNIFEPVAPVPEASLLFAVSHSLLFLAVAYWFYKRNWIIRV